MTLPHSSLGIALIAAVITAFRSGIVWGLLPYTLSLTPWSPLGFSDFRKKNSSFRLPYQRPSSSADCPRAVVLNRRSV